MSKMGNKLEEEKHEKIGKIKTLWNEGAWKNERGMNQRKNNPSEKKQAKIENEKKEQRNTTVTWSPGDCRRAWIEEWLLPPSYFISHYLALTLTEVVTFK